MSGSSSSSSSNNNNNSKAVISISCTATSEQQLQCRLYRHDSSTNKWEALIAGSAVEGGGGGDEILGCFYVSVLSTVAHASSAVASFPPSQYIEFNLNSSTTIVLQKGRSLLLQKDEQPPEDVRSRGGGNAPPILLPPAAPRSPFAKSSFSYVLEFLSVSAAVAAGDSITSLVLNRSATTKSAPSSASAASRWWDEEGLGGIPSTPTLAAIDRQTLADYIVRLSFDEAFRESLEAVDKILCDDEGGGEGFRKLFG